MLLQLLIDFPCLMANRRKVLTHPSTIVPHPIMSHSRPMACLLSGKTCKILVSQAAADIILASWKPGPVRQYCPHVQRW